MLPSLLWASVALNFEESVFTKKALDLSLRAQDKIPFSSKVLLSQVLQQLDHPPNQEVKEIMYRYEQIEMRDNTREYKNLYGVDLAYELQNAVKFLGLQSNTVQANTVNHDGYLMISTLNSDPATPQYLHLVNKFDYLTSGKAKTGYHTLKDRHLNKQGETVHISYIEALEAFKRTDNAKDFMDRLLPDHFN